MSQFQNKSDQSTKVIKQKLDTGQSAAELYNCIY